VKKTTNVKVWFNDFLICNGTAQMCRCIDNFFYFSTHGFFLSEKNGKVMPTGALLYIDVCGQIIWERVRVQWVLWRGARGSLDQSG
jgi:hypothetical protein